MAVQIGKPLVSNMAIITLVNPTTAPHRQVDAGSDDNKRLANGEDCSHGPLPEQILNVVRRRKALRAEREHNPHQREERHKSQAEERPQPRPVSCRRLAVPPLRFERPSCFHHSLSSILREAFFQGCFRPASDADGFG